MQKKIVHLIHISSKPGGIEVLLPIIIKNMKGLDFRVFLIRPPLKNSISVYSEVDIPITSGSSNNFLSYIRLILYCLKNSNDIFHLFNTGPVYLLILRLCRVKKILYSIHGTKYWKGYKSKYILKTLWKITVSKRIIMTSNSEYSKSVYHNKINKKSIIHVLYNPIDTNKFYYNKVLKTPEILKIIFVGRLVEGKGLLLWIEIAIKIHNELPNTQFEIWGEGGMRNTLLSDIARKDAESFIKLCGYSDEMGKVLQEANILLFLSEFESFGNVVVESILCGTPVITTAIPSMQEIFADYDDFLIPLNSRTDQIVIEKIRNYEKLNNLAISASNSFMSRFSIENHINKLYSLYNIRNE